MISYIEQIHGKYTLFSFAEQNVPCRRKYIFTPTALFCEGLRTDCCYWLTVFN